jgi:hypothetical protein
MRNLAMCTQGMEMNPSNPSSTTGRCPSSMRKGGRELMNTRWLCIGSALRGIRHLLYMERATMSPVIGRMSPYTQGMEMNPSNPSSTTGRCPSSMRKGGRELMKIAHRNALEGPFDGVLGFSHGGTLAAGFMIHHAKMNPNEPAVHAGDGDEPL